MAAGFVTGQQKADERLKIRKRAWGGHVFSDPCEQWRKLKVWWNVSLQRYEKSEPRWFRGKTDNFRV